MNRKREERKVDKALEDTFPSSDSPPAWGGDATRKERLQRDRAAQEPTSGQPPPDAPASGDE